MSKIIFHMYFTRVWLIGKSSGRVYVIRPRVYKNMLNSAKHEIFPAHKCLNPYNC